MRASCSSPATSSPWARRAASRSERSFLFRFRKGGAGLFVYFSVTVPVGAIPMMSLNLYIGRPQVPPRSLSGVMPSGPLVSNAALLSARTRIAAASFVRGSTDGSTWTTIPGVIDGPPLNCWNTLICQPAPISASSNCFSMPLISELFGYMRTSIYSPLKDFSAACSLFDCSVVSVRDFGILASTASAVFVRSLRTSIIASSPTRSTAYPPAASGSNLTLGALV